MEKTVLEVAVIVLDTAVLCAVLYLVALLLAGVIMRPASPPAAERKRRFAVVVPARNEERGIALTLESLGNVGYPRALYDIHVIADNCDDATASVAQQYTPFVHERVDPTAVGKGQALRWLLDRLSLESYDAVAIVDADSVVSPNFLAVMNNRLESGCVAVQAYYGVLQPKSLASSLRAIAFCLLHRARRAGLSALGASAGLAGDGMVFASELLRARAWDAFGVTEDLELHAKLVAAGIKVDFASETSVLGEMPSTLANSRKQNLRWERGRFGLARSYVPRLALAGVRDRDISKLLTAVDLALPPLSIVALAVALAFVASVALGSLAAIALAAASIAGLVCFVAVGLVSARAPVRLWLALSFAPVYAMWKGWLYAQALVARGTPSWTRAQRQGEVSSGDRL
jgi:1,2-diacylglycerol 3-beta-glucosyltransferase